MRMVEKRVAFMPTNQSAWERATAESRRPSFADSGNKFAKLARIDVFVMLVSQRRWSGNLRPVRV